MGRAAVVDYQSLVQVAGVAPKGRLADDVQFAETSRPGVVVPMPTLPLELAMVPPETLVRDAASLASLVEVTELAASCAVSTEVLAGTTPVNPPRLPVMIPAMNVCACTLPMRMMLVSVETP